MSQFERNKKPTKTEEYSERFQISKMESEF